ncbi:hypothetical protein K469DRAFT_449835, partial [Zopfia rhizophila CBS 207.26]
GRHTDVIMSMYPELVPTFFKILYLAIPVLYVPAVTFPKLAILDMYLHIFVERWAKWTSYATGLVIILSCLVNIPVVIAQCIPIAYLWDKTIKGGKCHNIEAHFLYSSLPNIVTDVVMLVLPIPMILKLHTSRKVRVGIAATFLTGSIGLITSIIRFVAFTISYADPIRVSVALTIWTIAEPGIYVVAACLISLRPL